VVSANRNFLEEIASRKRRELAEVGIRYPEAPPRRQPSGERFVEALLGPGVSVIAEIKRRSPSRPSIRPDLDPVQFAGIYEQAGAKAISVLTDGPGFGGSLDDIAAVKESCNLPVLRKDFLLDPVQIEESREWGADAVLLIVALLEDGALREMLSAAEASGLAALVEVHDSQELRRAAAAGATIIGVNNRDLRSFEVDPKRALELAGSIPAETLAVAESGLSVPEEVEKIARAGYDAVLVGQSILESDDPGATLASLVAAGQRILAG
jgi:indole-3-glycerol phosphate synthase